MHELREREDGQTTTEYAILLGFLAIAIIIALFFLRNVLRDLFSDAASSVSDAATRSREAGRQSTTAAGSPRIDRAGAPLRAVRRSAVACRVAAVPCQKVKPMV